MLRFLIQLKLNNRIICVFRKIHHGFQSQTLEVVSYRKTSNRQFVRFPLMGRFLTEGNHCKIRPTTDIQDRVFSNTNNQQFLPFSRIRRRLKLLPHMPAVADDFAGIMDTSFPIAQVDVIQSFHQLIGTDCVLIVTKQ